jgi:Uma2 family endonuclease
MPGTRLCSAGLAGGIAAAGLPCEALPDGMTVKIDEHTAYEPDTLVHRGEALADDAVIVPAPVIMVEVLLPSTAARDTGAKLADYFGLPSVCHA